MKAISPHIEAVGGIQFVIRQPGDNRLAIVFCNLDGALLAPVMVMRVPGGMDVTTIDNYTTQDGTFVDARETFGGISLDDPCVTPLVVERVVEAALDYVRRNGLR